MKRFSPTNLLCVCVLALLLLGGGSMLYGEFFAEKAPQETAQTVDWRALYPFDTPAPEKAQETAPAEEQSAPKAEEPKAEPLEPDDSPFVETASHAIRLDDLKFGRNYHGEE